MGSAAVEVAPSPKSQAWVRASPSASELPAEEKVTVRGALPEVVFAPAWATGAWPPVTCSMR